MKYLQKKDLPWSPAGTVWEQHTQFKWSCSDHRLVDMFLVNVLQSYKNNPTWFEKVEEESGPGAAIKEILKHKRHKEVNKYLKKIKITGTKEEVERSKEKIEKLQEYARKTLDAEAADNIQKCDDGKEGCVRNHHKLRMVDAGCTHLESEICPNCAKVKETTKPKFEKLQGYLPSKSQYDCTDIFKMHCEKINQIIDYLNNQ